MDVPLPRFDSLLTTNNRGYNYNILNKDGWLLIFPLFLIQSHFMYVLA
jgi:hypothetical protein